MMVKAQDVNSINYKQLFAQVPGSHLILSPALVIAAVSDAYLEATMTRREAIVGRPLFEVFPDDPDDTVADGVLNLRRSLMEVIGKGKAHAMEVQKYNIRKPDGSFEERYWLPLNKPVFDEAKELAYIIHTVDDVTDVMMKERELHRSQQRTGALQKDVHVLEDEIIARTREVQELNKDLEHRIKERTDELMSSDLRFYKAMNNMMEGVQIIGYDWHYLYVNDVVVAQSTLSRKQLLGHTMMEVYPGIESTELFGLLKQCMQDRNVHKMENIFEFPNGSSGYFELTIEPMEEGLFILSTDITQRKQAEQKNHELTQALEQSNRELEDKVVQRNAELLLVNEDLEEQGEQKRKLSVQLAGRNREIMDSISYARRIQNAMFPNLSDVSCFRDHARLMLPRDVVSGDFLWYNETGTHLLFAVADCTGHGVPGAMMSLLANGLLERSIGSNNTRSPDVVLEELDHTLEHILTRYDPHERINDGMDIGLFMLNKATRQLLFSGAFINCIILRNGEVHELVADRKSIGGHLDPHHKRFTRQEFQLLPGDRIVLSTDGYRSQLGGPKGRKINSGKYRMLLQETSGSSAQVAIDRMDQYFRKWQGRMDQMDDVLVVMLDV